MHSISEGCACPGSTSPVKSWVSTSCHWALSITRLHDSGTGFFNSRMTRMYKFRPCKRTTGIHNAFYSWHITNKIGRKKRSCTPSRARRPSFANRSIPVKAPCWQQYWASIKLNACAKGPHKMIWSNNQLPAETQLRQLAFREDKRSTVNFANNDCGYNDNSQITTEFPCPEQSPIPL